MSPPLKRLTKSSCAVLSDEWINVCVPKSFLIPIMISEWSLSLLPWGLGRASVDEMNEKSGVSDSPKGAMSESSWYPERRLNQIR